MKDKFNKIDEEILKLDNSKKLDISSIENILIKNIEEYKIELHKHIEEILQQQVDEKEL
jgi:N-acetyl-gamma-glutamylphosphate reductase